MTATPAPQNDQALLWKGEGGHAWVEEQPLLDAVLQPYEDVLVNAAVERMQRPGVGNRILDIGCGTGATTLAIARHLGTHGTCTGIDISEPMLALARVRAQQEGSAATFVCADAQDHRFAPASFDLFVSRFGVMFFDNPVAAFSNLRRAAATGAQMRLITWRGAAENPFMTTAERAAAPLLPDLPARQPDAPGQFAFADPDRVRGILEAGGWNEVALQPIDATCTLPRSELQRYLTRLGPLGRALDQADEATRRTIIDTVIPAFDPFVEGAQIRFTGACWMVSAVA